MSRTVLLATGDDRVADLYGAWLRDSEFTDRRLESPEAARSRIDDGDDLVLIDDRTARRWFPDNEELARARNVVLGCATDRAIDAIEIPFDDFLAEPTAKDEAIRTLRRVRRRNLGARSFRSLYRPLTTIALVRAGTSVRERCSNERYRRIVGRFMRRYADHVDALGRVGDDRLTELFGSGDRANLVRYPTATLDVRTDATQ